MDIVYALAVIAALAGLPFLLIVLFRLTDHVENAPANNAPQQSTRITAHNIANASRTPTHIQ